MRSADVRIVGLLERPGREVIGPLHGPGAESGDGFVVEAVDDEGFVVGPFGACQIHLKVFVFEATAGVAAAELLEFGAGPAPRGCEHVDEVAGRSAIGEGADFGPDDVLLRKDGPVGALGDRPPEDLLEDVDFAALTGDRIGHGEAGGQGGGLQRLHLTAPCFRAATEGGCDVGHRSRILGGDIEVLARTVHQAVRPYGISPGEDQQIRGADSEDIRQEPRVQFRHVPHAAERVREASGEKASSHTVRTVRPTRMRSTGHI